MALSHAPVRWLFATAIFLGAFLLFLVQPLIGKYILPWFGGTSGVWATSMLFFMTALLLGYGYSFFLTTLKPRAQGAIHITFVSGSILLLIATFLWWDAPILPGDAWKPQSGHTPLRDILLVLTVAIGLPYVLLATTGSLLQAWFRRVYPNRSPYGFYALSNIAAFLAVGAYPFLIEPLFSLETQGRWWSTGFLLYCLLILSLSFLFLRFTKPTPSSTASTQDTGTAHSLPRWKQSIVWIFFSAIPTITLLSVTNYITQGIAAAPLLWLLPLMLYLLSYAIAFLPTFRHIDFIYALFLLGSLVAAFVMRLDPSVTPLAGAATYLAFLFAIGLFCHRALYRLRPHPHHLTSYYFLIALGGVVGGLIVGIVAPLLFSDFWEMELSLFLAGGVAALSLLYRKGFFLGAHLHRAQKAVLAGTALVTLALFVGLPLLTETGRTISTSRNFYGVLHLTNEVGNDGTPVVALTHGDILHGNQIMTAPGKHEPTTYYSKDSGIGRTLLTGQTQKKVMHVGVIGLGTGTLATYCREGGDTYTFYEINPAVVRIAREHFTYLSDCKGEVRVEEGDARLVLERDLANGKKQLFDVLAVDAFSDDAIPVHLLTKEAFEVYLAHLAPDGALAFHISNKYLDLVL